ncbi:MAG: hypothetical protein HKO53_20330 [Gemmatimonadetes bacterium]|nr:hypothetical protein [Gemmatimonadota bacterium]
MSTGLDSKDLERLLTAVGDLLADAGSEISIVVVGGATLGIMGWVSRTTHDVDVIAQAERRGDKWILTDPHPLPPELTEAVGIVARDFNLPRDWLNAEIGDQWSRGLPPGTVEGLSWRTYEALHVGFAGRSTLIALKLFAAVDQGPSSVHFQDLTAMNPTPEEIRDVRKWVLSQDSGEVFPALLDQLISTLNDPR